MLEAVEGTETKPIFVVEFQDGMYWANLLEVYVMPRAGGRLPRNGSVNDMTDVVDVSDDLFTKV